METDYVMICVNKRYYSHNFPKMVSIMWIVTFFIIKFKRLSLIAS